MPTPSPAPRARSRRVLAVVLALAVAGLVACGDDDDTADAAAVAKRWAPSPIGFGFRADPDAATRFLDLATRRQTATYRVDAAFQRDVDGRDPLRSEYTEINRPPDHVVVSLGGVTGRIGDRAVTCDDLPTGDTGCTPGAPAPAIDAERAAEIEELRSLVDPATGTYRVDAADGLTVAGEAATCFGLRLRTEVIAPRFGRWAYLCDVADGVPLSVYVVKVGSRDVRTATAVSRTVSAADVTALVDAARGG